MSSESFQSKIGVSPFVSSVERLPERRRTIEEMSVQDWIQKVQRLKNYNTKLESDLDHLQEQYDHLFQQKETIRRKAKELTDVVRGIYSKYDELENLVKIKDEEIRKLNHRIEELEVINVISSRERRPPMPPNNSDGRNRGNFSYHSLSTETTATTTTVQLTPETNDYDAPTIHELNQVINSYQNREKELVADCCKLRARVAELEGTLAGTLYYSAMKGSPAQPPLGNLTTNISSRDNKSLVASPERKEVESFLDVLRSATFPAEGNTPNRNSNQSLSK